MPPPCARFTLGSIPRHVLTMTSTSTLGLLAVFLVDILTLVYVARLDDQTLLAAVGLGKLLLFINSAFVSGVVIAAGALLSARIGKHAGGAVARLASHLLWLAIGASGLVAGLEWLCVGPVGRGLGIEGDTYQAALGFTRLALPSSVLVAAAQTCAQMLRAQGHVRQGLLVLLAGAATLAIADPLLIFAFGLGLPGAGLACLLSAAVSLALGLFWVRRHIGLSASWHARLARLHIARALRIAVPASLGNLAMPVGVSYLMAVLAGLGTSALAGMAVVDRVMQLCFCAFFALPNALVPVIAQNLGAGRDDRARQAVAVSRRLVLGYGLAVWLALIGAGPLIADYFHLQGTGRGLFLDFCHFGAGAWLVFGMDFIALSTFLTLGSAWWVPVFGWLRGTLGTLPLVFLGARWAGATGALNGFWSGNMLVALASIGTAAWQARRFFRQRAQH